MEPTSPSITPKPMDPHFDASVNHASSTTSSSSQASSVVLCLDPAWQAMHSPVDLIRHILESIDLSTLPHPPPIPLHKQQELIDWLDQIAVFSWQGTGTWNDLYFTFQITHREILQYGTSIPFLFGSVLTDWILRDPVYIDTLLDRLPLDDHIKAKLKCALQQMSERKPPADIDIKYYLQATQFFKLHDELLSRLAQQFIDYGQLAVIDWGRLTTFLQSTLKNGLQLPMGNHFEIVKYFIRATLVSKQGEFTGPRSIVQTTRFKIDSAPQAYRSEKLSLPLEIVTSETHRQELCRSDFKLSLEYAMKGLKDSTLGVTLDSANCSSDYWKGLFDLLCRQRVLSDKTALDQRDLHRLLIPLIYGLRHPQKADIEAYLKPFICLADPLPEFTHYVDKALLTLGDDHQARIMVILNFAYLIKDHLPPEQLHTFVLERLSGGTSHAHFILRPFLTSVVENKLDIRSALQAIKLIALITLCYSDRAQENGIHLTQHIDSDAITLKTEPYTLFIPLTDLQPLQPLSEEQVCDLDRLLPNTPLTTLNILSHVPVDPICLQTISRLLAGHAIGHRLLTLALFLDPTLTLSIDDIRLLLALNFQPTEAVAPAIWQDTAYLCMQQGLFSTSPPEATCPLERESLWIRALASSPLPRNRTTAISLVRSTTRPEDWIHAIQCLRQTDPALAAQTLFEAIAGKTIPLESAWSMLFEQTLDIRNSDDAQQAVIAPTHQRAFSLLLANQTSSSSSQGSMDLPAHSLSSAIHALHLSNPRDITHVLFQCCLGLRELFDDATLTALFQLACKYLANQRQASGVPGSSSGRKNAGHLQTYRQAIIKRQLSFAQAIAILQVNTLLQQLSATSSSTHEPLPLPIKIDEAVIQTLSHPPSPLLHCILPYAQSVQIDSLLSETIEPMPPVLSDILLAATTIRSSIDSTIRLNLLAFLLSPKSSSSLLAAIHALALEPSLSLEQWNRVKNDLLIAFRVYRKGNLLPKLQRLFDTLDKQMHSHGTAQMFELWTAWLTQVRPDELRLLGQDLLQTQSNEGESPEVSCVRQLVQSSPAIAIQYIQRKIANGTLSPKQFWELIHLFLADIECKRLRPVHGAALRQLMHTYRADRPSLTLRRHCNNGMTAEHDKTTLALIQSAETHELPIVLETLSTLCSQQSLPVTLEAKNTWLKLVQSAMHQDLPLSLHYWHELLHKYQPSDHQIQAFVNSLHSYLETHPTLSITHQNDLLAFAQTCPKEPAILSSLANAVLPLLCRQLDEKGVGSPSIARAAQIFPYSDLIPLLEHAIYTTLPNRPTAAMIEWIRHIIAPAAANATHHPRVRRYILSSLSISEPHSICDAAMIDWLLSREAQLALSSCSDNTARYLQRFLRSSDQLSSVRRSNILASLLSQLSLEPDLLSDASLIMQTAQLLATNKTLSKDLKSHFINVCLPLADALAGFNEVAQAMDLLSRFIALRPALHKDQQALFHRLSNTAMLFHLKSRGLQSAQDYLKSCKPLSPSYHTSAEINLNLLQAATEELRIDVLIDYLNIHYTDPEDLARRNHYALRAVQQLISAGRHQEATRLLHLLPAATEEGQQLAHTILRVQISEERYQDAQVLLIKLKEVIFLDEPTLQYIEQIITILSGNRATFTQCTSLLQCYPESISLHIATLVNKLTVAHPASSLEECYELLSCCQNLSEGAASELWFALMQQGVRQSSPLLIKILQTPLPDIFGGMVTKFPQSDSTYEVLSELLIFACQSTYLRREMLAPEGHLAILRRYIQPFLNRPQSVIVRINVDISLSGGYCRFGALHLSHGLRVATNTLYLMRSLLDSNASIHANWSHLNIIWQTLPDDQTTTTAHQLPLPDEAALENVRTRLIQAGTSRIFKDLVSNLFDFVCGQPKESVRDNQANLVGIWRLAQNAATPIDLALEWTFTLVAGGCDKILFNAGILLDEVIAEWKQDPNSHRGQYLEAITASSGATLLLLMVKQRDPELLRMVHSHLKGPNLANLISPPTYARLWNLYLTHTAMNADESSPPPSNIMKELHSMLPFVITHTVHKPCEVPSCLPTVVESELKRCRTSEDLTQYLAHCRQLLDVLPARFYKSPSQSVNSTTDLGLYCTILSCYLQTPVQHTWIRDHLLVHVEPEIHTLIDMFDTLSQESKLAVMGLLRLFLEAKVIAYALEEPPETLLSTSVFSRVAGRPALVGRSRWIQIQLLCNATPQHGLKEAELATHITENIKSLDQWSEDVSFPPMLYHFSQAIGNPSIKHKNLLLPALQYLLPHVNVLPYEQWTSSVDEAYVITFLISALAACSKSADPVQSHKAYSTLVKGLKEMCACWDLLHEQRKLGNSLHVEPAHLLQLCALAVQQTLNLGIEIGYYQDHALDLIQAIEHFTLYLAEYLYHTVPKSETTSKSVQTDLVPPTPFKWLTWLRSTPEWKLPETQLAFARAVSKWVYQIALCNHELGKECLSRAIREGIFLNKACHPALQEAQGDLQRAQSQQLFRSLGLTKAAIYTPLRLLHYHSTPMPSSPASSSI